MIILDTRLQQRHRENRPIKVGFIGAGMMAKGILNLIERHIPGMRVAAIANRTLEKAKEIYAFAGVDDARFADSPTAVDKHVSAGGYVVTDHYLNLCEAKTIDVLVEITGTIDFGAKVLLDAFRFGKNVITFNAEVDATLGPILSVYAERAGVIYSGSDGDQPGVTMNLYRYVKGLGVTPLLCGNIKGLHDPYRNPTTQEAFAKSWGMGPEKATSFADGTKLCLEQTCVANATGMKVAKRGMLGYEFRGHVDDLKSLYDIDMLRSLGGIVDYAIGAQPGPGVFVYGTIDDALSRHHLKYYKLGEGPLYSFYHPYHLCIFEVPTSIVRVVDFGDYVLKPLGAPSVEVIAKAKKDLEAGAMLDGPGFYTVYGECENSDVVREENLLPVGLADKVRLKRSLDRDTAITWDDVEVDEDSLVFRLYREQQNHFQPTRQKVN